MASHIPFVHTSNDLPILRKLYADSPFVRISLFAKDVVQKLPKKMRVWLDPGIDIYHNWPPSDPNQRDYYRKFDKHDLLSNNVFTKKSTIEKVNNFVNRILDECLTFEPDLLSVPQLPMVSNTSRNSINRALADATAKWRNANRYGGKLILPVIITHQEQVNLKINRSNVVKLARDCLNRSFANAVWVVESSLSDHSGSGTLGKRFSKLVDLHKELISVLPEDTDIIAGPYWGMNLVLWARGLATYPAIGLGRGYQYFIPGQPTKPGKRRIAIPSLRRLAFLNPDIKKWINHHVKTLPRDSDARRELEDINKKFDLFDDRGTARRQVAQFYKGWLDRFDRIPAGGRALALYQDLSNAFVLGRSLSESLPRSEGTARRPEKVAQQLMLHCL